MLVHDAIDQQGNPEATNSLQKRQKNPEEGAVKMKNIEFIYSNTFFIHPFFQSLRHEARSVLESDTAKVLFVGKCGGPAHFIHQYRQQSIDNTHLTIDSLNFSLHTMFNNLSNNLEAIKPKLEPDVIVLAFDVLEPTSFKRLTIELEHVKRCYPNSGTLLVAVESSSEIGISYEEGEQWAFSNEMMFLNHNKNQCRTVLLCKLKEAYDKNRF
jgi:hypothetical protein